MNQWPLLSLKPNLKRRRLKFAPGICIVYAPTLSCGFYSGSQACKSLCGSSHYSILHNSSDERDFSPCCPQLFKKTTTQRNKEYAHPKTFGQLTHQHKCFAIPLSSLRLHGIKMSMETVPLCLNCMRNIPEMLQNTFSSRNQVFSHANTQGNALKKYSECSCMMFVSYC